MPCKQLANTQSIIYICVAGLQSLQISTHLVYSRTHL